MDLDTDSPAEANNTVALRDSLHAAATRRSRYGGSTACEFCGFAECNPSEDH